MSGAGGAAGAPAPYARPLHPCLLHSNHSASCGCALRPQPVQQSLDELEFERSACKAALDGNVPRLEHLASTRPHLLDEASGGAGLVPLHYACRAGKVAAVQFLLRHGSSSSAGGGGGARGGAWRAFCTSVGGATPLHKAAASGHAEIVAMLLDSCGGVGAGAEEGKSEADDAARSLAMAADADGATALHLACASGRQEAAALLLRRFPEAARVKDGRGRTPRDRWVESGQEGGEAAAALPWPP